MIGDENTKLDALALYLSGASSDGGSQPDPDLSFGNFRSSTRISQIGHLVLTDISGVSVERVCGTNGQGFGALEVVTANSLRWTAPDDSPGAAVIINNGQTKLLESADDRKFIVVKRHTASDLTGVSLIKMVPIFNNTIGSNNVNDTERQAGENKLRCMVFKCMHDQFLVRNLKVFIGTLGTQRVSDAGQLPSSGAGTIETTGSLSDWPATGFCRIETSAAGLREIVYYSQRTGTGLTVPAAGRGLLGTSAAAGGATDLIYPVPGIKIAKESPTSDHFTVCTDENDTAAVSGFTWYTGITRDTGLMIGHLGKDEIIGIWVWLVVVAGASASPSLENLLKYQFGIYDTMAL